MGESQTSLVIELWNAAWNAIHVHELSHFLSDLRSDVGRLIETHLNNLSHCYINGYALYNYTHSHWKSHAGSVILLCHEINYIPLPNYRKSYNQSNTVATTTKNGKFTLTSVYYPPNRTITSEQFYHYFQSWEKFYGWRWLSL